LSQERFGNSVFGSARAETVDLTGRRSRRMNGMSLTQTTIYRCCVALLLGEWVVLQHPRE